MAKPIMKNKQTLVVVVRGGERWFQRVIDPPPPSNGVDTYTSGGCKGRADHKSFVAPEVCLGRNTKHLGVASHPELFHPVVSDGEGETQFVPRRG